MTIKNIIFDLGGVIIDINYPKTAHTFEQFGAINFNELYTQSKQDSLFDDFETGKMSAKQFRQTLCQKLNLDITDDQFDQAWNAMLLDLPGERLEFIKSLRAQYRVFLFSNTNAIHLSKVFEISKNQNGHNNFYDIFEKQYYSHLIGYKKPHQSSFETILKENDLVPEETIFIDDTHKHVLGAREAGIHAIHLTEMFSIFDTLDFIKSINSRNKLETEAKPLFHA